MRFYHTLITTALQKAISNSVNKKMNLQYWGPRGLNIKPRTVSVIQDRFIMLLPPTYNKSNELVVALMYREPTELSEKMIEAQAAKVVTELLTTAETALLERGGRRSGQRVIIVRGTQDATSGMVRRLLYQAGFDFDYQSDSSLLTTDNALAAALRSSLSKQVTDALQARRKEAILKVKDSVNSMMKRTGFSFTASTSAVKHVLLLRLVTSGALLGLQTLIEIVAKHANGELIPDFQGLQDLTLTGSANKDKAKDFSELRYEALLGSITLRPLASNSPLAVHTADNVKTDDVSLLKVVCETLADNRNRTS